MTFTIDFFKIKKYCDFTINSYAHVISKSFHIVLNFEKKKNTMFY